MDFKIVVDVCTIIGAIAVMLSALRFVYKKAKIASEKQHYKNQSLKLYIETLLSKDTTDTKRNEIYPYVSLLANSQTQFSIDMRLRFNLMSIISFIIVIFSSFLLFIKTDGKFIYLEESNLFIPGILMILFNIGIIFTVAIYTRILKKVEHMQVAINDTYLRTLGNQIDNKYIKNKT